MSCRFGFLSLLDATKSGSAARIVARDSKPMTEKSSRRLPKTPLAIFTVKAISGDAKGGAYRRRPLVNWRHGDKSLEGLSHGASDVAIGASETC
jgi:hypothetical protein